MVDNPHQVLQGIGTGDHAYFVHSYAMDVANPAERLAHVDYGGDVTAIIGRDTMIGTQFHPEADSASALDGRIFEEFVDGVKSHQPQFTEMRVMVG